MESKNAARFLAFDSLKGLKESINEADLDVSKKSATLKSEEDKREMDVLIYKSYIRGSALYVSYLYKGYEYESIGSIKKIDSLKHILWMEDGKKIYLAQITGIREP